jgi:hypothetical protein
MAYRLDSQRIFDAEPATEAVPAHSSPQLPSRSFGFHNSQSPSKPGATAVLHHAAPSISSPSAVAVRSAASPTELSGTSSACPTSLFPGSGSPPRPSKRVGIFPHDAHADWDFLKSGATGHPTRLTATEPGLILSTLQRGLAHVPERRPLTEAEVNCCGIPISVFLLVFLNADVQIVAAASKEIRQKTNAPVREQLMLRYMGPSQVRFLACPPVDLMNTDY